MFYTKQRNCWRPKTWLTSLPGRPGGPMGPTSPLLPWKNTTWLSAGSFANIQMLNYHADKTISYQVFCLNMSLFTSLTKGRHLCLKCLNLFSVHPSANVISAVHCGYRPLEITGTSVWNAHSNFQHLNNHLTSVMVLYVHILFSHLDCSWGIGTLLLNSTQCLKTQ